jgi:hypothetical protein
MFDFRYLHMNNQHNFSNITITTINTLPLTQKTSRKLGLKLSRFFKTTTLYLGGIRSHNQGCQMADFPTKNPNLGKFWRDLQWKMLVYFMAMWSILRPFCLLCSCCMVIWYIFPVLVYSTEKNLATLLTTHSSSLLG